MRRSSISELQSPLLAKEYAQQRGIPESAVISRINRGLLDGAEQEGTWYVEDRSAARRSLEVSLSPEPGINGGLVKELEPESAWARKRRERDEAFVARSEFVRGLPFWRRAVFIVTLFAPAAFGLHLRTREDESATWLVPAVLGVMLCFIVWTGVDEFRKRSKGDKQPEPRDV